ncbi:hypothetical protein PV08_03603 [Exophiala spinifera]|uniref:F-box domain-containing protein n=1 Tax=Exophiala spinifera TaxID=91928 RepID=A0A0D2C6V0_9EURO|nr:uncharacterized protein PV08_03603 [Exophiala spinifera]KIW19309.1 hypothetical protein PV08_03603 [Exophiala spinifera]
MTLRRSERIHFSNEDTLSASSSSRSLSEQLQDGWNLYHPPSRGLPQRTIPSNVVDFSVKHLFATDYGPKTLAQFLREEIDKLRQSATIYTGKGKGKMVETPHLADAAQPGVHHRPGYNHTPGDSRNDGPPKNMTHHLQSSVEGAFADEQSIHRAPSAHIPGLNASPSIASASLLQSQQPHPMESTAPRSLLVNAALRRSERLSNKAQNKDRGKMENASPYSDANAKSNREDGTKSPRDSENPFLQSVKGPGVSAGRDNVSDPYHSATSFETVTDSDRRSHFEEHTKTRRHLVRDVPSQLPIQKHNVPDHLRTRLRPRQTFCEGPVESSPNDANVDGLPSNTEHVASPDHNSPPTFRIPSKIPRRPNCNQHPQNYLPRHTSLSEPRLENTQPGRDEAQIVVIDVSKFVDRFFWNMSGSDEACSAQGDVGQALIGTLIPPSSVPSRFNYTGIVPPRLTAEVKRNFLESAQRITGSLKLQQLLVAYDLDLFLQGYEGARPINPSDVLALISDSDSVSFSYGSEDGLKPKSGVMQQHRSLDDFDEDRWMDIAQHLSPQDIRNLRLVSRALAQRLGPILFRNVVVNFGKRFFDIDDTGWESRCGHPPSNSVLKKHGDNINQFGIAFEYDLDGLANASEKVIEKEQDAWFGRFTWPTENYPRYPSLQAQEDLVDHNRPLLREALKHVTKASELGLCIDSGHGWLEGPDISDLALFQRRTKNGSAIFGDTFKTEDMWTTLGRNQYFHWAQQNTIDETTKWLNREACDDAGNSPHRASTSTTDEIDFVNHVGTTSIESFREKRKPANDFEDAHIGVFSSTRRIRPGFDSHSASVLGAHPSQWPLIFGGYNLAAELGGVNERLPTKIAHPYCSPLLPGSLTEAQAQWLMETAWAQRAFLSAYTTAVITNKQNFTNIHTLRISKLSSGLLPSMEQQEFWRSLPGLKNLKILVSPDWRQDYLIGDRAFATNMLISPAKAAERFTRFLRLHVTKLETLLSLTVGYAGGGEDAVGMFARNQHVLFAPIVEDPRDWLHRPARPPWVTRFDHVRELKFKNCWFTPWMLRAFMEKSKDTSLHTLNLDSVSMTAIHDSSIDNRILAQGIGSRCAWPRSSWLNETLSASTAWCQVLDDITPGVTLLERKYDAGMIDEIQHPRPKRAFRGHVRKLILKSCGYVKISLPKTGISGYSQNALLAHSHVPMDQGLFKRMQQYVKVPSSSTAGAGEDAETHNGPAGVLRAKRGDDLSRRHIMLSTIAPNGEPYPWLGTLTQCVHPVEKRVLEEAWGMTFGWQDDLARFGAVEDGFFEGGTGRFSGVIERDPSEEETISD